MSDSQQLRNELLSRWSAAGRAAAVDDALWQAEGSRLLTSWSRWPRRYHALAHLSACLQQFDVHRTGAHDALALELAIWFHDAIYWPWRDDNEARSAEWASTFLRRARWPAGRIERVHVLVMATRHTVCAASASGDSDTALLLDIDLAILGAAAPVYAQFERDVRAEYRFMRWTRYCRSRADLLQGFLDRDRIYTTKAFAPCEAPARANLAAAIAELRAQRLPGRERV